MKLENMRPSEGFLIVEIVDGLKNCTSLVVAEIVRTDSGERDRLLLGRQILIPTESGEHFWEISPDGQEIQYALIKEEAIRVVSTEEPEKKK